LHVECGEFVRQKDRVHTKTIDGEFFTAAQVWDKHKQRMDDKLKELEQMHVSSSKKTSVEIDKELLRCSPSVAVVYRGACVQISLTTT
jgi:hypothetical protein